MLIVGRMGFVNLNVRSSVVLSLLPASGMKLMQNLVTVARMRWYVLPDGRRVKSPYEAWKGVVHTAAEEAC